MMFTLFLFCIARCYAGNEDDYFKVQSTFGSIYSNQTCRYNPVYFTNNISLSSENSTKTPNRKFQECNNHSAKRIPTPETSREKLTMGIKKIRFDQSITLNEFYLTPEPNRIDESNDIINWGETYLSKYREKFVIIPTKYKNMNFPYKSKILSFRIDKNRFLQAKRKRSKIWRNIFATFKPQKKMHQFNSFEHDLYNALVLGLHETYSQGLYDVRFGWTGFYERFLSHGESEIFYFCPFDDEHYFLAYMRMESKICFEVRLKLISNELPLERD